MGCVKSSREIRIQKQTLMEIKTKEEIEQSIGVKNFIKGPKKN